MLRWREAIAIGVAVTAGAASASIIDVPFDDGTGSVTGILSLVDIVVGPPPGAAYFPPPDAPGANDVTLVFQISVTAGDVTELGVGLTDAFLTPLNSTGVGWIPNNPAWADVAGVSGPLNTRIFTFDPAGGIGGNGNSILDAGETSDYFFVSYEEGTPVDGSLDINFMIQDGVPTFTISTPLIPGPGGVALGFGILASLAFGGRRRDR
jgi:hypothetical protein